MASFELLISLIAKYLGVSCESIEFTLADGGEFGDLTSKIFFTYLRSTIKDNNRFSPTLLSLTKGFEELLVAHDVTGVWIDKGYVNMRLQNDIFTTDEGLFMRHLGCQWQLPIEALLRATAPQPLSEIGRFRLESYAEGLWYLFYNEGGKKQGKKRETAWVYENQSEAEFSITKDFVDKTTLITKSTIPALWITPLYPSHSWCVPHNLSNETRRNFTFFADSTLLADIHLSVLSFQERANTYWFLEKTVERLASVVASRFKVSSRVGESATMRLSLLLRRWSLVKRWSTTQASPWLFFDHLKAVLSETSAVLAWGGGEVHLELLSLTYTMLRGELSDIKEWNSV